MIEKGFLETKDQDYRRGGGLFGAAPVNPPRPKPNVFGNPNPVGGFGNPPPGGGLFGSSARRNPPPPVFGGGGGGLFGRGGPGTINKVLKIEKIMNSNIFDKFTLELRKTLKKYPSKKSWDLIKLLFHGSKNTSPEIIYSTEYGLDNRFSHDGMYG